MLARLRYYSAELLKFIKKESAALNVLFYVRVGALRGAVSEFSRLFADEYLRRLENKYRSSYKYLDGTLRHFVLYKLPES